MTTGFAPVTIDAPLVNPAPNGLFGATSWTEQGDVLRWLPSGVAIRVFNYGGDTAHAEWTADWCAAEADLGPADLKTGERPDFPDSFLAITTYAADDCDLTERSRAEVQTRARQVFNLQEPLAVEAKFATRLLADAGTPTDASGLLAGVAFLEGMLAKTNTLGQIHASAEWAAYAVHAGLAIRTGATLKTPLGHQWVFGGGYIDTLGATLVATSPTLGWRGNIVVQDAPSYRVEEYTAIAERSLVVGYEWNVGAVTITGSASVNEGFPGGTNFPGSTNFPVGA